MKRTVSTVVLLALSLFSVSASAAKWFQRTYYTWAGYDGVTMLHKDANANGLWGFTAPDGSITGCTPRNPAQTGQNDTYAEFNCPGRTLGVQGNSLQIDPSTIMNGQFDDRRFFYSTDVGSTLKRRYQLKDGHVWVEMTWTANDQLIAENHFQETRRDDSFIYIYYAPHNRSFAIGRDKIYVWDGAAWVLAGNGTFGL